MLELISDFSNISGYKIKIEKPVVFLYTNKKLAERENKKASPYMLHKED